MWICACVYNEVARLDHAATFATIPTKAELSNLSPGVPKQSAAPCIRRGHTQAMRARLSRAQTHQPFNQLPLLLRCQRTSPLLQRLVRLPSRQAHRYHPSRMASCRYSYWSTTAAHPIYGQPDPERRIAPARIPGAPTTANCYGAGSHELLLIAGTTILKLGVENTNRHVHHPLLDVSVLNT